MRRLAKELDDMKSIVSLLAVAPDRAIAVTWASELEKNGFAHHTADEIKKSLLVSVPSGVVMKCLGLLLMLYRTAMTSSSRQLSKTH